MGATNFDGPSYIYGNMGAIPSAFGEAAPDYNLDAGPSMSFQGDFLPDIRYPFMKDKVTGYTGVVPGHLNFPYFTTVDAVPAALNTANIAALQNVTNATAMTLASSSVAGVTTNIPVRQFSGAVNGGALVTAPIVLDYGFAFGNVTSGSTTITVADSTQFQVGMPLVIANVGNAGGTAALMCHVATIPSATTITVDATPLATLATAAIGTGNLWGPSPVGFPMPDSHLPYIEGGPALIMDPRQTIARSVSISGVASGTGGNFIVSALDIYWQPTTMLITVGAGANTANGKKAVKAILSVTPQFTDAHNYSVGTTDIYGFHVRNDRWEYNNVFWAGAFVTVSTGWLAAVTTTPTNATGDVRGTYATQSASTGTISSLAMSGNRLAVFTTIPAYNLLNAQYNTQQYFYGMTQA